MRGKTSTITVAPSIFPIAQSPTGLTYHRTISNANRHHQHRVSHPIDVCMSGMTITRALLLPRFVVGLSPYSSLSLSSQYNIRPLHSSVEHTSAFRAIVEAATAQISTWSGHAAHTHTYPEGRISKLPRMSGEARSLKEAYHPWPERSSPTMWVSCQFIGLDWPRRARYPLLPPFFPSSWPAN